MMQVRNTPQELASPKAVTPPVSERVELTEEERKFLAECEAAYEANPTELYTLEEVVAHIKRKK